MKNKMTNSEYKEYVKTKSPNSKTIKNCFMAFLFGGLIYTKRQGLMMKLPPLQHQLPLFF